MQRKNILRAAVLSVILAIPVASADWFVHGTYEPDTKLDQVDNFMWLDPDVSPDPNHQQIYFNVVQNVHQTGQNPNVGLLKPGMRTVPFQTFFAYLGVWKDCNLDNVIGLADGAVMEYREELLPAGTPCAADSAAVDSPFRQDGWVYEFLWIGPNAVTDDQFTARGSYNDSTAHVWGDSGVPGTAPRGSCAINPTPAGTTASTGGLIQHVDCIAARRIAGTVNQVAGLSGLPIGFENPEAPQDSDSPLNVRFPVHPFYDPYREDGSETGLIEDTEGNGRERDEAFTVFDCKKQGTPVAHPSGEQQDIRDPTNESTVIYTPTDANGTYYTVPATADSPNPNAQGSFYDALNESEVALVNECRRESGLDARLDDFGADVFGLNLVELVAIVGSAAETYNSGVSPESGRRQTDVYFYYNGQPASIYTLDDEDNDWFCITQNETSEFPGGCSDLDPNFNGTISEDIPQDGGVAVYRQAAGLGASWQGSPNYLRTPQTIRRDNFEAEGADYWSFYAHVGISGWQAMTPSGTMATYGAEAGACGTNIGAGQPVRNGWDCDPTHWWNPEYDPATDAMPTQTADMEGGVRKVGVTVGQPYNLRDIDCWDGEVVGETGVYASAVSIVENGPCQRPWS